MPEGLSPSELTKEIQEHREHTAHEEGHHEESEQSHLVTIIEAVVLAVVAVMAAYSGYASAKWGTESSIYLAKASTARTEANRASIIGATTRNFDALTFSDWFTAYDLGNKAAMVVAERRFRPQFRVAFNAWLTTHPFTNPHAPPEPTNMPQYVQPGLAATNAFDAKADVFYTDGAAAAENADRYVLIVVYLASVLFLIGISSHFHVRSARIALIVVGVSILTFSIVLLVQAPKPTF